MKEVLAWLVAIVLAAALAAAALVIALHLAAVVARGEPAVDRPLGSCWKPRILGPEPSTRLA